MINQQMHAYRTDITTAPTNRLYMRPQHNTTKISKTISYYYSWNNFNILIILNISNKTYVELNVSPMLHSTACNLAGSNYELPEDDAVASKHVGAVQ
jgi:hypothetical protein